MLRADRQLIFTAVLFLAMAAGELIAFETIEFKAGTAPNEDAVTRTVTGELLVEAQDGGLLVLADDGRIWTIQPEQLIARTNTPGELVPIDDDEMNQRMMTEMPEGFSVYRTANYLIVHNTDENHARQVGGLFEQLYRSFFSYWKNQRWELTEPRFPLVALLLDDHDSFLKYAQVEIGESANSVIGYYHLSSNRMTTFNVPNWERNIATIIHEATHQLAYNCGLQRRFADNPMWVSEGLAMFFESPDRRNSKGWRGIGRVNQKNLRRWNLYLPNRPSESLATLIADDSRFRSPATAADAYGEGWALTYFLLKTQREDFVEYLKRLSEVKPLVELSKRERIEMFEDAFDTKLETLDKQFVAYMKRVR
ncbi:hypothetical protein Pla52o_14430 [Novipirellula galeiformis]|uniref:DUF1570 domain-containing protein n=1 Tax=Novipirellula galeiformis TaxID=2528004 RepID=A0A5C6CM47_9BACT|nr:DUF1570 domain-containing protein [Novipirellula galeiformis]TWU25145.1 hypothetical protein Pla52o_14430 [Novipirellula galeiformis]